MDWGVSADNYGWAILGVVAPVVLTGLLLVRYRRATLGPESALAGMIMLAMLGALGARWLPDSARFALATGGLAGFLISTGAAGWAISRQKRRRGRGGRVSSG